MSRLLQNRCKSSEKAESIQKQESEKDRKESVKGTPFDSEAEEEEEEEDQNQESDDKIEETMQASSSFAEITPDSEPNEKSPKNETPTAANDN